MRKGPTRVCWECGLEQVGTPVDTKTSNKVRDLMNRHTAIGLACMLLQRTEELNRALSADPMHVIMINQLTNKLGQVKNELAKSNRKMTAFEQENVALKKQLRKLDET